MQRILVVCGAGASSTFLVHWMRKAAASRGLELDIFATAQGELRERLPGAQALLAGSHLAESFPEVEAAANAANVPALLLPALPFDESGATAALALLEDLLASSASDAVGSDRVHTPGSHRG